MGLGFLIGTALFLYAIVPLVGAFLEYSYWRRLRAFLLNLHQRKKGRRARFYVIDAFTADGGALVRAENKETAVIKLDEAHIYNLIDAAEGPGFLEDANVSQISLLPNRAPLFAAGRYRKADKALHSGQEEPLLVVFYDGRKSRFYERMIAAARARHECWNFLTPWSLMAGALLSLALAARWFGQGSGLYAVYALAAGILPFMAFLPPGIFMFALLKKKWAAIRKLRASYDLHTYAPRRHGAPAQNRRALLRGYAFSAVLLLTGLSVNYLFVVLALKALFSQTP